MAWHGKKVVIVYCIFFFDFFASGMFFNFSITRQRVGSRQQHQISLNERRVHELVYSTRIEGQLLAATMPYSHTITLLNLQ
jgi:hypothetical protein